MLIRILIKRFSVLQTLVCVAFLSCNISQNYSESTGNDLVAKSSSYKGLVMAGYQGWFNAEGDGANRGWNHYRKGNNLEPGHCTIDYWPEMSEYPIQHKSPFYFANGEQATLFSSYDESTADMHFKWMQEYDIDGVFVQRFVSIFSCLPHKAIEGGILRYGTELLEKCWLEQDLKIARKTKGIDWMKVFTHYPLHSFGWSNVKEWKERITPILDKYNVDRCLSGQRHAYERHHPLRDGKPVVEGEGTVYITNGISGGSPQGVGGFDLPTMAFTPRKRMYDYAVMRVSGNTLKYEVINLAQVKIDEFELI